MDKRYQVFISSTFADLEEERKGIMEAIIELDCFPAGMEMFPATDTEQFEYIKSIIDESDYYVLVIAGRYGSVAEDGISYTEKEYEYAKEIGIPILTFVKKDIENIAACKTDQDPQKKIKLDEFRNKALSGRMAKFWDSADDLKYKIHNSLSKEFKTHPRIGWVKGSAAMNVEILEQINHLQKENSELKKLTIKTEESMDEGNRENAEYKKLIEKLNAPFEVGFYISKGGIMDIVKIRLMEIIQSVGLSLRLGIDLGVFKDLIEKEILSHYIQDIYGIEECWIEDKYFKKLQQVLLALNIADIQDGDEEWFISFTELGNKVFLDSIEI